MKTGNNIHFPRLKERLKEDSVVTRTLMWAYKNVAQSNTESVISTDPKVGNFLADRAM